MALDDWDATWHRVARHEAGHCVVAVRLGIEIRDATLHRHLKVGSTIVRPSGDPFTDATIAMAGDAACPLIRPMQGDLAGAIAAVGRDRVGEALQAARRLLAGHEDALRRVAEELLAHGTVSGARIVELVHGELEAGVPVAASVALPETTVVPARG